jgi:hypothetical protein
VKLAAPCAALVSSFIALALPPMLMAAAEGVAPALAGELTRVDLTRRSLSLKLEGREGREIDADTSADTRIVSHGRTLRLEDLRPGDRVLVLAGDDAGKRVARVIKVVGRPTAVPSPSPAASASPASSGAPG